MGQIVESLVRASGLSPYAPANKDVASTTQALVCGGCIISNHIVAIDDVRSFRIFQ